MKNLFLIAILLVLFCVSSVALAGQDPCAATQHTYELDGYTLGQWVEVGPVFSPAPQCQGTVILLAPDGTWYSLDYIGQRDVLTLDGIPCTVTDNGDLSCKIITRTVLRFDKLKEE